MNKKKRNIVYLEILRTIAIFSVLFCHSGEDGIYHFMKTDNQIEYVCGLALATINHLMIPLFFMISGALLLKKEECFSYVYRHRVLRIAIIILLISTFQYSYHCYESHLPWSFTELLRKIYEGNASTPLWYLYAYLSMLLFLPVLQRVVKAIPAKWFWFCFAGYVVFNYLCPIFQIACGLDTIRISVPMMTAYVLYFFSGHYIAEDRNNLQKSSVIIMISIGTIILWVLHCYLNHRWKNGVGIRLDDFIVIYAAAVFVFVRYLCKNHAIPKYLAVFFCYIGQGSFGIYLFEEQLRKGFYPVYENLVSFIGAYPATFCWLFTATLFGAIIVNFCKHLFAAGSFLISRR
ncbi:MAG: acyltransferase [Lachnospiraceae bacterium]